MTPVILRFTGFHLPHLKNKKIKNSYIYIYIRENAIGVIDLCIYKVTSCSVLGILEFYALVGLKNFMGFFFFFFMSQ